MLQLNVYIYMQWRTREYGILPQLCLNPPFAGSPAALRSSRCQHCLQTPKGATGGRPGRRLVGTCTPLTPVVLDFTGPGFTGCFTGTSFILNDEGCFGVVSIAFCAIATSFATASPDTLQAPGLS